MTAQWLQNLPTELVLNIVERLSTPADLIHLLKTSRRIEAICFQRIDGIFIHILQRSIAPEAMQFALGCVEVVRHCPILPQGHQTIDAYLQAYQDSLRNFLSNFWSRGIDINAFFARRDRVLALAKLAIRVDRFVDDYFVRTQSLIRGIHETYLAEIPQSTGRLRLPATAISQGRLEMSETERARLQRAFFCFEMYSRCFPIRTGLSGFDHEMVNTRFQLLHFIVNVSAWQLEELACVYEYLWLRLEVRISWYEQRLLEEIMNDIGVIPLRARDNMATLREQGYTHFSEWSHRLFLYSLEGKRHTLDDIACCLSSGLSFLEQMILASPEAARDLIRSREMQSRGHFHRGSLRRAIRRWSPNDAAEILAPRRSFRAESLHVDHPSVPNYRIRDVPEYRTVHDFEFAPLRQCGHAIWDTDLLRQTPAFDNRLRALERTWREARMPLGDIVSAPTAAIAYWHIFLDAALGKSVEEQLPNMLMISGQKMEVIVERYGRRRRVYDHATWRSDEPVERLVN
jgi:hypothetical protein